MDTRQAFILVSFDLSKTFFNVRMKMRFALFVLSGSISLRPGHLAKDNERNTDPNEHWRLAGLGI